MRSPINPAEPLDQGTAVVVVVGIHGVADLGLDGLVERLPRSPREVTVVPHRVLVQLVEPLAEPKRLLPVDRVFELLPQDLFGAGVMPLDFEVGDERRERSVRLGGQDRADRGGKLAEGRFERIDGLVAAGGNPQRPCQAVGDVQPVEGAGDLLVVQGLQLPNPLVGQFRMGDRSQGGQQIGHQARLAFGPLALEGPLECGHCRVGVRAGLIQQLGRPALDQRLQQVERPLVDRGLGPLADLGQMLQERIGRRLVSDFGKDGAGRLHPFEEGVDLGRGVPHHGVGQAGQQAEIARRLVELLELAQVVLGLAGLLEDRREGPDHVGVQLAGHASLARRATSASSAEMTFSVPRFELAGEPSAQPPFFHGLEHGDEGPLVERAAPGEHVPPGQRAVVGRFQLVGRLDRLE